MSSGQHLSKDIHELIRQIGETRSKQEEDKIISLEVQLLKQNIEKPNQSAKKQKENLLRAIYIDMLGHDSQFALIHAVNLTHSKHLSLKKIGYLVCSLFFNENNEFLILLVSTIQRDLQSENILEVITGLNALSKLLNEQIIDAVKEQIVKLLNHNNEMVRKKAIMIMYKMVKIDQNSVPDYQDKIKKVLYDKDPSVMGACLNVFFEDYRNSLEKGNITRIKQIKELTGSFVVILKQIIEHKLNRDYDFKRMPAPWIQIKIMQLMAMLGENDQKVSEQMYEILGQALKRADDTGTNIGLSITYECVVTISKIYPNQYLLEQAASSISRFLTCENNSLKYLGINGLINIINVNSKYCMEHQMVVVECLENPDETLKRKTFELLIKMTNQSNLEVIVDKLINFLKQTLDQHFQKEMVNKICQIAENYAQSQEWYLNTMNNLFQICSQHITSQIISSVITLIQENYEEFGDEYAQFLLGMYSIDGQELTDSSMKLVSWIYGEIGNQYYDSEQELWELAGILIQFLEGEFEMESTKGWILNALAKLSIQIKTENYRNEIDNIFKSYRKNTVNQQLQQRCIEYFNMQQSRKGLSSISSLEIDSNLSFLNSYVQKALDNGAKRYDIKQTSAGFIQSLNLQSKKENLNYTPYQQKKEQENQTGLKITGPSNWTKDKTYKKEEKKTVAGNFKNISSQNIQSMGSQPENPKDKKNKNDDKNKKSHNMQSISSNDFRAGVIGTSNYSVNDTKKEEEKKQLNSQQYKEKQALVSNLFVGFDDKLQVQKKTHTFGKPNTFTKKQNQTQNKPQSKQQQKQKEEDLDLLGDFDNDQNNLIDFGSNQQSDKQNTVQKQVTQPKQNLVQIQMEERWFAKLKIDLDQFQEYWESYSDEVEETVNKVMKEQAVLGLINKIGFGLVEQIDNQFCCAAKDNDNDVVLLFIEVNDHNLEIKVKNQKEGKNRQTVGRIKSIVEKG